MKRLLSGARARVVCAFAVGLFLLQGAQGSGLAVIIDKIVAVVNEEVITQREVAKFLLPAYSRLSEEYTGTRLEVKMKEAERDIIEKLIDEKLILSEAKRRGIEAPKKEIERKIETVRSRFSDDEEFRKAITHEGITLNELRERIEEDIIKSNLVRQEMGWKAAITPIEVKNYYDEHPKDYQLPAQASVLSILVKKENENRSREDSEFLIKKIEEFARFGKDFEILAIEYSEDNEYGQRIIEKGQMISSIDKAIFCLKAGEISEVVESPIGFHLYKMVEKKDAKAIAFENVKEDIENLLFRKKIDKNLQKWLRELKEDAYISIK